MPEQKEKQQEKAKIKAAVKRRKRETYTPVKPDMQLGFVHNNVDCIGCPSMRAGVQR